MKIVVAIDKFKGSLTSLQAAAAIQRGMERAEAVDNLSFDIVEIADGGDGSASVLQSVKKDAKIVKVMGINPLGKKIESSFLLYSDGLCAFIEMAKISGLELVSEQKRDPMVTTTYGLGQLVKAAFVSGAKRLTLSIGGSATNDGGTGLLQAIGFKFYNKQGRLITDYMCGGLLGEVGRIEEPEAGSDGARLLQDLSSGKCELEVICDVTNPLLGENGATMVYGPQKGADEARLAILESGMANLVSVVCSKDGWSGDTDGQWHLLPGSGAAGGVGYAAKRFLNAGIISGWRFFAGITGLEERIRQADLVISGEGRIDGQSLSGKVIDGVLNLAGKYSKPVWLFCGINTLQGGEMNVKIFQLADLEPHREKSMANAAALLEQLAYKVFCI